MNKLIALDHECNKRALHLFFFKEEEEEDMLYIVKKKLHNRLQIETIGLIEANGLEKLIENKEKLIQVKVSSTKQKYTYLVRHQV